MPRSTPTTAPTVAIIAFVVLGSYLVLALLLPLASGVRQGAASRVEERFAVTPDGKRLTDNLTITDPTTFTKPAVLKRAWVWRASERVNPYQCGTPQKIANGA